MYSAPIFQRPRFAFGLAIAFSVMYFAGLRALSVVPGSPATFLLVWLVPVAVCGVFHFIVVRGSDLSGSRRWVQVIASAIGTTVGFLSAHTDLDHYNRGGPLVAPNDTPHPDARGASLRIRTLSGPRAGG